MFEKLLNRHGYYKISQLDTGGWCGICGSWMDKEIFPKDEIKFWRVSIFLGCINKHNEYEELKEKVEKDIKESREQHRKLWNY